MGPGSIVDGQLASADVLQGGENYGGSDTTLAGESDGFGEVDAGSFESGLSILGALELFGLHVKDLSNWEVDGAWNVSSTELVWSSDIKKLVISLSFVVSERFDILESLQLGIDKLVVKVLVLNLGVFAYGSAFRFPFGIASIQDLDIWMSHGLKHPGSSVSKELHGTGIITNNLI